MSYLGNNGNLSFGLAGSQFAGLRNLVINGNFDFWQRGSSLGSGTGIRYLADRFVTQSAGTTYTTSRQTFTLGQTDVPGEPTFFHRNVVTSVAGASNFCVLVHKIEDVRLFSNKTYTLSFWAKADASKNIAVEFVQDFGGGGSPSAFVTAGVFTVPLTTLFQKFSLPILFPSIVGKTLGNDGSDSGQIVFWFDSGSSFNSRNNSLGQQSGTFDISQVQMERGGIATPFEVRSRATEIELIQRYYSKSFLLGVDPAQNAGTAGILGYIVTNAGVSRTSREVVFPVRMRSTPVLTFFNPSGLNANWRNFSLGADSGAASVATFGINERTSYIDNPQVAGDAVTHVMGIHWTADAEL